MVSGPPPFVTSPAASVSSDEPPHAATDRVHRAVAIVSAALALRECFTEFLLVVGWMGVCRLGIEIT